MKVDLAEAFYHITLHPQAQRLTPFRLDGVYYSFTRLPFEVRPAPFLMQSLATAIARTLRSQGLWAWAYIDNFLIAHSDPVFLSRATATAKLLQQLHECGFRINPRDTLTTPTREIRFLGFNLSSYQHSLSHSAARQIPQGHPPAPWHPPAPGLLPKASWTLVFLFFFISRQSPTS